MSAPGGKGKVGSLGTAEIVRKITVGDPGAPLREETLDGLSEGAFGGKSPKRKCECGQIRKNETFRRKKGRLLHNHQVAAISRKSQGRWWGV